MMSLLNHNPLERNCKHMYGRRGFLGLKPCMPRTEELSGRKYTMIWIRSAIISSKAGQKLLSVPVMKMSSDTTMISPTATLDTTVK